MYGDAGGSRLLRFVGNVAMLVGSDTVESAVTRDRELWD